MKSDFKILIVDDEVLIAEFLKDELIDLGYHDIVLAHNRKQAFAKIEEFKPQLILLDIRMKNEREGIEIAEEINKGVKIPFIFITAHSDKEILQHALSTKPAGYITKPFKQIDVYAAVSLVESNLEKLMDKFIMKNNLPVHKKMELTSNEAVKQAVIAGLGYSIMPLIGIKNELMQKDLQIIPVKNFPIKSMWNLIWMKNKSFSPVPSSFLKYIKQEKNNIIKEKFEWFENF